MAAGTWSRLTFGLLTLTLSAACAHRPTPSLPILIQPAAIPLDPALEARCDAPGLPQGERPAIGEVLSYALATEAALAACEARRAGLAALIRAANDR